MFSKEAGQYYQYHSAYEKKNISFVRYDWLGVKESDKIPYYVIIENRELSFYEGYAEKVPKSDEPLVSKAPEDKLFFMIDFTNLGLSYDKFNAIFTNSTHRDMVLDFFWDLYINKNFTHSLHFKELKLRFDSDPYYSGVVAKLCYYILAEGKHPYDKKLQLVYQQTNKGSVYGKSLQKEKITAVQSYWKYLLDEKHETYYKYGMSSGKSRFWGISNRRNLWFNSLEDELKPVLLTSRKKGIKFESKGDFINLSARLLIKRYSLLDALTHILPLHLGLIAKYSLIILCCLIMVFVTNYYWQINIMAPTQGQFSVAFDYLKVLLWVFIAGLPLIHLLGSISTSVKNTKLSLWALFPQIYLPRLLIALSSGWMIFITAEETTRVFDVTGPDENFVLSGLLVVLGGAMLVLMYNEIKSTAPSESSIRLALRSVKIFLLGFIMSLSIGYLFASPIFNKMKADNSDAMADASKGKIDDMTSKLDSLDLRLLEAENLENRIKKLTLSPEDVAPLSAEFIYNKSILEILNELIKYEKSYTRGKIDNRKEIDNLLIEKIKNLQKDSVFKNFNVFEKQSAIKTHLNFDSLQYLTKITGEQYSNLKWRMSDYLFNEKNNINKLKLEFQRELKTIMDEQSLKTAHFRDSTKYIQIDDGFQNTNLQETDPSEFIPFNQILNKAILALFIGVFFQLVIQDKTITEPI